MIFDRHSSRAVFFEVWRKQAGKVPGDPLQEMVHSVIMEHPEYHAILSQSEAMQSADFAGDNPFLHMGMHIAIREQIGTDRPAGITERYRKLLCKYTDEHELQHRMMRCLHDAMWSAQKTGLFPDEENYLNSLKKL